MYICPTCQREFSAESALTKHFLACWKEQHPYHKSNSAPRSEDVTTREVDSQVMDFFSKFQER